MAGGNALLSRQAHVYNKEMRTYNITYHNNDLKAIGENFKALNACDAILQFFILHPEAQFVAMHDIEALSWVDINRGAIQKLVDEEDYNKNYP